MEMPFVGFSTLKRGQQHGTGASPQRIGTMQQQQQSPSTMQRQIDINKAPPCIEEEINRLAKEYQEEGALLAERLSLCGIHQQSLSMEAQNSLKLLVQLACVLQVTQTAPQALLAAWAMLLIRQGKATTLQRKIQCEREALAQKRRTAQQKHAILQKVHTDVQATQQKDAKNIEQVDKWTRHAQVKVAGYKRGIEKFQHKLAKNGFTQEATHTALLQKHEDIKVLKERLQDLQQRLNKYHGLPASLLGARMKLDEAKQQLAQQQERFRSHLEDDAFV